MGGVDGDGKHNMSPFIHFLTGLMFTQILTYSVIVDMYCISKFLRMVFSVPHTCTDTWHASSLHTACLTGMHTHFAHTHRFTSLTVSEPIRWVLPSWC